MSELANVGSSLCSFAFACVDDRHKHTVRQAAIIHHHPTAKRDGEADRCYQQHSTNNSSVKSARSHPDSIELTFRTRRFNLNFTNAATSAGLLTCATM